MWLFVISATPTTRCTRSRPRRPALVNNQDPTETSRTKSFHHYIVIDDIKFESLRPDFALSEITSGGVFEEAKNFISIRVFHLNKPQHFMRTHMNFNCRPTSDIKGTLSQFTSTSQKLQQDKTRRYIPKRPFYSLNIECPTKCSKTFNT